MLGDASGSRSPLIARTVRVPFAADSVAPPRLVYGALDLTSAVGSDRSYTAIYFEIADGSLGRVTFEGFDAVRAARGETLPYDIATPATAGDWVFTVEHSPWLAERHRYEMQRYSTPLSGTHQHYVFQFHDEFIEAIAEGIWLDEADRTRPFARPRQHPLAELGDDLPCERFRSTSGIEWELRRSPRSDTDLIHDSQLCSQRLYQFTLLLDGRASEGASIWLRSRGRRLTSRFVRPWPGGEIVQRDGLAQPSDFEKPWEAYLAAVADRRRKMGR